MNVTPVNVNMEGKLYRRVMMYRKKLEVKVMKMTQYGCVCGVSGITEKCAFVVRALTRLLEIVKIGTLPVWVNPSYIMVCS